MPISRRAHPLRLCAALCLIGALPAALSGCSPVGVAVGLGATAGVMIAEERSIEDAGIDTRITLEISEALFQAHIDDLFGPTNIDVVEGRVLLSGMVRTQELADRGGGIAWQASGVRKVYNEYQIGDGSMVDPVRDRWITTQLRGRLLGDENVYDVNYTITTVAGTLYLIGIARGQAELDLVTAHASDIAYVRRLVSHVVMIDDPIRLPNVED